MGLAIETAELMEHFQWIGEEESRQVIFDPQQRPAIVDEVADVACYLLALANVMQLDLGQAVLAKLQKNAQKYPAEKYRGRFRIEDDRSTTAE